MRRANDGERKTISLSAIVFDDANSEKYAPMHPGYFALRLLRTTINGFMLVGDDSSYLGHMKTYSEPLVPRPVRMTILFRQTLQHFRYWVLSFQLQRPIVVKRRSTQLVIRRREQGNHLLSGRSSLHIRYWLPRARHYIMNADLYYHTMECCAP